MVQKRIPLRLSGKLLAGSTVSALRECEQYLRKEFNIMDRSKIAGIEDNLLCYCMMQKVDSYAAMRKSDLLQSTQIVQNEGNEISKMMTMEEYYKYQLGLHTRSKYGNQTMQAQYYIAELE